MDDSFNDIVICKEIKEMLGQGLVGFPRTCEDNCRDLQLYVPSEGRSNYG